MFGGNTPANIEKVLKQGNKLYNIGHYVEAASMFEQVITQNETPEILLKLGICYFSTSKFEKCISHLKKLEADSSMLNNPEFHYWYGNALHHTQQYAEAVIHYKQYYKTVHHYHKDDAERLLSQIDAAMNAKDSYESSILNKMEKFDGSGTKFTPVISLDGHKLYFTSLELNKKGGQNLVIYESIQLGDLNWTAPEKVPGKLNESGDMMCLQLFDNDSKMLLHKNKRKGDIYISELQEAGWSTPKPVESINSKFRESAATITEDGNRIYFSSDILSEGQNLDILYVDYAGDGIWGSPMPLDDINTKFDEASPFITAEGQTLYFSSNGPKSIGGFDVFKVGVDQFGTSSAIEHCGLPINSTENDLDFRTTPSGHFSLFSSDRSENGNLELYSIVPQFLVHVNIILKSSITNDFISDDHIELYFRSMNDANYSWEASACTGGSNIEAQLIGNNDYHVDVISNGELIDQIDLHLAQPKSYNESINLPLNIAYQEIEEPVFASSNEEENETSTAAATEYNEVASNVVVATSAQPDVVHDPKIKNRVIMYCKTGDASCHTSEYIAISSIINVLAENENAKLLIEAHTCDIGSDDANLALSEKRALEVKSIFTNLGISESKIDLKALGETEPAIPNNDDDAREKNRRVELSIFMTEEY